MSETNPYVGPCSCDHDAAAGDDPGFCGDKQYVSSEEQLVLASMRRIRRQADPIRAQLKVSGPGPRRQELQARLTILRQRFSRERQALRAATRRKLRRLGHL